MFSHQNCRLSMKMHKKERIILAITILWFVIAFYYGMQFADSQNYDFVQICYKQFETVNKSLASLNTYIPSNCSSYTQLTLINLALARAVIYSLPVIIFWLFKSNKFVIFFTIFWLAHDISWALFSNLFNYQVSSFYSVLGSFFFLSIWNFDYLFLLYWLGVMVFGIGYIKRFLSFTFLKLKEKLTQVKGN